MKRAIILFAVVSLTSILGCASTQKPQKLSDDEAAMQELNRQRSSGESAQPAPKPAPKPAKKK